MAAARAARGVHVKHQPRNLTSPEREITAAAVGRIHSVLELSRRTPVLRSLDELLRVAAEVASTKRELIYTTVSMDRALVQLVFLRQWFGNLGARARNVLLVGANEHTCQVVREASIPCFADAAAPTQRGRQNGFGSQVTLKWWYARVLAEARFHLIFSDPDVVWLRDPFAHWERSFDFQGLSDIRSVNLTVQSHHEITCMRPWMENMCAAARALTPSRPSRAAPGHAHDHDMCMHMHMSCSVSTAL